MTLSISTTSPCGQESLSIARKEVVTEHTKIITKNGIKKNGSLLYTIIPLQEVMEQHYEHQFNALERTTERRKVQAKLAEQLGA